MMKKCMLLVLLMVVLAATACSNGKGKESNASNTGNAGGQSGEKVDLRYSRWGSPDEIKGTQAIIDKFNSTHPNIKVKLEYADWGTYWTKLQTQMASGSAPDVFLMDSSYYVAQFAAKQSLQDLTPYLDKSGYDKSKLYDGLLNIHSSDGKLYAMPRDMNSIIMMYNKDLFDAAKLAYPTGDLKWNDVIPIAQKLTKDKKGKTADDPAFDAKNVDQYGLWLCEGCIDSSVESMIHQNGGKMFNDDNSGLAIDTPEAREVFQFFHDAIYKYHISPTPEAAGTLGTPFSTGKVAMVYDGSWMIPTYNQAPFKWDVTLPPTFKQQAVAVQSVGNSMSSKTKHSDAAWQLIQYLSDNEAQTMMAKEGGSIPAIKSIAESDFLQGTPEHKKAFLDAAQYGFPQKSFLTKGEVIDTINQNFSSYLGGIMSLDDFISKTKAAAKFK